MPLAETLLGLTLAEAFLGLRLIEAFCCLVTFVRPDFKRWKNFCRVLLQWVIAGCLRRSSSNSRRASATQGILADVLNLAQ